MGHYGKDLKLDGYTNKWKRYPSLHEDFVRQITQWFLQSSSLGPA